MLQGLLLKFWTCARQINPVDFVEGWYFFNLIGQLVKVGQGQRGCTNHCHIKVRSGSGIAPGSGAEQDHAVSAESGTFMLEDVLQ